MRLTVEGGEPPDEGLQDCELGALGAPKTRGTKPKFSVREADFGKGGGGAGGEGVPGYSSRGDLFLRSVFGGS